jgi:hypothetical protein
VGSDSSNPPRFFVLKHARGSEHDTDFLGEGDNVGEAPRCPRCGGLVGMRLWLPPYRGKLEQLGSRLGDFVLGPGNGVLLSERMANAFRVEGLTGLEGFHPVEVRVHPRRRSPKPEGEPKYVHALPTYGGAVVDEARSRIRRTEPIRNCPHCRASGTDSIHGFSLEPGSWSSEDVFRPRGLHGLCVVSEYFAHFVARHGFTNMTLTFIGDYTWDPLQLGPPTVLPNGT